MTGESTTDTRGMAPTVSHLLAIAITTIVIAGLLVTANSVYQIERRQVVEEELRIIGNRLADELARAASLADAGGNVSMTTRHQTRVGGMTYTVDLETGASCDEPLFTTDACLALVVDGMDLSVTVPVRNATPVTLVASGAGTYSIRSTPNASTDPHADPGFDLEHSIGIGDDVVTYRSGNVTSVTNRNPIAGFTLSPGRPTVDSVIHFRNDTDDLDGLIETYNWTLGDGTTRTDVREFNHSYAEPGKYTVTLTVEDDDGATAQASKVVTVGGLVYDENATAGDVSGDVSDGRVNFTVTNRHDDAVTIKEVYFDPADDGLDWLDDSGEDPAKELEILGSASDHTMDSAIQIHDGGFIHDLSSSGNGVEASVGSSSSARVELAGFGQTDGTPKANMSGKEVVGAIRYEVGGVFYTTQFTLFGPGHANEPPDPAFSVSCTDVDCSFVGTASSDPDGSIVGYEWTFGDGSTATGTSPSHSFAGPGTYDVSLTVEDDNGTTATLTRSVSVGPAGQWYDADWGDRKPITIDHASVSDDLADFPVLVRLTDPDLAAEAQPGGEDVLFTAGDGISKLSHEIESYIDATGELVAWVNVTTLSGSENTTIYLYYDNPSAGDQQDAEGVWEGGYEGVWHLDESPADGTPGHDGSTANDNDGTPENFASGDGSTGANGVVAGANEFDGEDDYVSMENGLSTLESTSTLSAWVRVEPGVGGDADHADAPALAGVEECGFWSCSSDAIFWGWLDSTGNVGMRAGDSTGAISETELNDGTWHHVVLTRDASSGTARVYVDASLEGTETTGSGDTSESFSSLGRVEGSWPWGDDSYFDGALDEVRVSSTVRSGPWVETSFANQDDPGSFYTVGDEQSLYEESGGQVVVEAENYSAVAPGNDGDFGPSNGDDMSDQTWSSFTDPGASGVALQATPNQGDSALDTENGERLDYYVNVSTTGTYYVWARVSCPAASDDAIHVGLDGSPATYGGSGLNADASGPCHNTTGWTWVSHAAGTNATVDVTTAGPHVVNVWMLEDGVKLDRILLTTDPSLTPTGTGPAESPTT